MRCVPISFLLAVVLVVSIPGCARQAEHCWVCEREIHASVRATLTLADGRKVHACCPRCALHYQAEPWNGVKTITVIDHASGKTLPFDRAFFVEGSDETPCVHHPNVMDDTHVPMQACYDRCMPSLIAFRNDSDARAFMSEHGGTLHPPGAFPGLPPTPR
ncbi:MAG: nitrous oxide reductase accessory protein NosL [Acidobacteria bacterium]|nr:nitrous oxide reductase accessory protein NosL [Acidobacteriota bacterium]